MAGLLKPAVLFIALLLLGTVAAVVLARPDPGEMISFSEKGPRAAEEPVHLAAPAPTPPIDSSVPINLKTATFAMG